MLVKVVDHKGKERYINAAFVKAVHPKGDSESEIELSGWTQKLRVKADPETVALAINQAMPDLNALLGPLNEEEQNTQTQQAAIVATIG